MVGPDAITLPEDTPWLRDPDACALCSVLENAGHASLFVGGCVRNAVIGEPVSDIDISTDARPERVMRLASDAGFRALPTGIDHGTVTIVVRGKGYEVTTFRKDVETDGRRARVLFSTDIQDDARRRDFTMNALYARSDGTVLDPLGGLSDARARRVRFIEDAETRIREDYLRILRFFRFSAWYADPEHGFDPEALAAIAACLDGLASLSAERIGAEMMKLLAAPNPSQALATMDQIGVLARCIPVSGVHAIAPLVHSEVATHTAPNALRRLAALSPIDAMQHLRLARKVARDLDALIEARDGNWPPRALGFKLGAARGWDAYLLRQSALGQRVDQHLRAEIQVGSEAVFPLKAKDFQDRFSGPDLGAALTQAQDRWLLSNLTLDKASLLG